MLLDLTPLGYAANFFAGALSAKRQHAGFGRARWSLARARTVGIHGTAVNNGAGGDGRSPQPRAICCYTV